ncbi:MAG TPA: hypothetical protein VK254_00920 [Candidatus Bathyarchaeia archaeon]|nr:hypothetical protein [Candidatus Bathyarchaeia archaeon]
MKHEKTIGMKIGIAAFSVLFSFGLYRGTNSTALAQQATAGPGSIPDDAFRRDFTNMRSQVMSQGNNETQEDIANGDKDRDLSQGRVIDGFLYKGDFDGDSFVDLVVFRSDGTFVPISNRYSNLDFKPFFGTKADQDRFSNMIDSDDDFRVEFMTRIVNDRDLAIQLYRVFDSDSDFRQKIVDRLNNNDKLRNEVIESLYFANLIDNNFRINFEDDNNFRSDALNRLNNDRTFLQDFLNRAMQMRHQSGGMNQPFQNQPPINPNQPSPKPMAPGGGCMQPSELPEGTDSYRQNIPSYGP